MGFSVGLFTGLAVLCIVTLIARCAAARPPFLLGGTNGVSPRDSENRTGGMILDGRSTFAEDSCCFSFDGLNDWLFNA